MSPFTLTFNNNNKKPVSLLSKAWNYSNVCI